MRLRLVQKDITTTDLIPYVKDAANSRVDLICFGELAATGCLYQPGEISPLDAIIATLTPYSLGIMFGAPRRVSSGLRNSYIYIHDRSTQVYDKINLFPPFNEDDENNPADAFVDLKRRIERADAVVIATPEYNYSVPGVLKNAIDWASRPYGNNSWAKKARRSDGCFDRHARFSTSAVSPAPDVRLPQYAPGEPARGHYPHGRRPIRRKGCAPGRRCSSLHRRTHGEPC